MAFWGDNYIESFNQANRFAGENGRLATVPDIINARLSTNIDTGGPWIQYFTTQSAEYFGYSPKGVPLIVVAHGVGPLSTPEGVVRAYTSRLKPRRHGRKGLEGRISRAKFQKLLDGQYGDVAVIDLKNYLKKYQYPFLETLNVKLAMKDPIVQARLGKRCEEYLLRHEMEAEKWAERENMCREKGYHGECGIKINRQIGEERFNIIQVGDANNTSYKFISPDPPIVHLLYITQLAIRNSESLYTEINCHEGLSSVRLVGIRGEEPIEDICPSISIDSGVIATYLDRFLRPNPDPVTLPKMVKIRNFALMMFTEHPDKETGAGNSHIEFPVSRFEPIGDPIKFVTEIKGYHIFFRYNIEEIIAIAPEESNAYYFTEEPRIAGDKHVREVQFYRAEINTSQKVLQPEEIESDFDEIVWINSNSYKPQAYKKSPLDVGNWP